MPKRKLSRWQRFGQGARDALTRNLPLKTLALVLAGGLWAFVNFGERETEEALRVPIELRNIPSRLMITGRRVDFVDIRVVGPRTLLGRIDHNQLSIPLDLNGASHGPAIFTVHVDRLNLPRGVRVVRVTPAQVTVRLSRVRDKTVPVELRVEGEPPADFKVTSAAVKPKVVRIVGPESLVDPIETVATEVLTLDANSREPIQTELPLEHLGEYVTPGQGYVNVDIRIDEIIVSRTLSGVPVTVLNAGTHALVEPEAVAVTLEGPRRVLEPLVPGPEFATVDAVELGAGEHSLAVTIFPPEEATVSNVDPEEVMLTLVAPTPTPTLPPTPTLSPTAGVPEEAGAEEATE